MKINNQPEFRAASSGVKEPTRNNDPLIGTCDLIERAYRKWLKRRGLTDVDTKRFSFRGKSDD